MLYLPTKDFKMAHISAGDIRFIRIAQIFIFVHLLRAAWTSPAKNNPPRFRVPEEVPSGTLIADLGQHFRSMIKNSTSKNSPTNLTFSFVGLLSSWQRDALKLDANTGRLTTGQRIDRESICSHDDIVCAIELDVTVEKPPSVYVKLKFEVEILDVNDNSPTFRQEKLTKSVLESTLPGILFQVTPATDSDSLANSLIRYQLDPSDTPFSLRILNNSAGNVVDIKMVLTGPLDREVQDHYSLVLTASDSGTPPRRGTLPIDVYVDDVNDNHPQFEKELYDVRMSVNAPVGSILFRVTALDLDQGQNGKVKYRFSKKTRAVFGHVFSIDAEMGEIKLDASLQALNQIQAPYNLVVEAEDEGENALDASATILIHVGSTNDHAPDIVVETSKTGSDVTKLEIAENNNPNALVARVFVFDQDSGRNGMVECHVTDPEFDIVAIYEKEFKLIATESFDRETRDTYQIIVNCRDLGEMSLNSSVLIQVSVTDQDDNPPIFKRSLYNCSMEENNEKNAFLVKVEVDDPDLRENAEVEFALESDSENWFAIDPKTGVITALVSFDREFVDNFDFHVIARGGKQIQGSNKTASYRHVTRTRVHVNVLDLDDEVPRFSQSWYKFSASENKTSGTEIGRVSAVDDDLPPFNRFYYHLETSVEDLKSEGRHFVIDPVTGVIYTRQTLDRELQSHYTLRVRAGNDVAIVFVKVDDVNDNAPTFTFPSESEKTVHVTGNLTYGSHVTYVTAYDRDSGSNADLVYSITSGNELRQFSIDPKSGEMTWNSYASGLSSGCFVKLNLLVRDGGMPNPLSTTSHIYVVFDDCRSSYPEGRSFDPPTADGRRTLFDGVLTDFHFLIVAAVLACCILVVVVLVAAICVTRHQTRMIERRERLNRRRMNDTPQGGGQPGGDKHEEEDAVLMFDRTGDKEPDKLTGVVLSLRSAEPVCRFQLQSLAPTSSDSLIVSPNRDLLTRDRDTDSGYADVSPV